MDAPRPRRVTPAWNPGVAGRVQRAQSETQTNASQIAGRGVQATAQMVEPLSGAVRAVRDDIA